MRLMGATLCSVEGCDDLAYPGDDVCPRCREEIDALTDAMLRDCWKRPADPAYAVRQAERDERTKRFIAVFLFVLAGEGIVSFAFDFPFAWAWLLIQIGWALVVAVLAVWICGPKERTAR